MNLPSVSAITTHHVAALCKAMGDPMRMEILRVLAANSYGVLELAEIFAVTQPRMSHHLKVLASANLVSTRREGNAIFYRRPQMSTSDALAAFKRCAFATLDACNLDRTTQERLERVHLARAEVSSQFFVNNAEKFRAQQDLIASYPVYAQTVTELLDNSPLPARHSALEIGPGEGDFLPALAQRFQSVTAVDTSESMLVKAQAMCAANNLANVTLVHGDTTVLEASLPYDCAVINMVLHHTPSPLVIFKHVYPALKTGGVLLITELCLHDQNWVKEACGDLWLGFDPNDIHYWASETGFTAGQSHYLALKNGFQIQLKQFIKI